MGNKRYAANVFMHVRLSSVILLVHTAPHMLNKWMLHVKPEMPNKVILTSLEKLECKLNQKLT